MSSSSSAPNSPPRHGHAHAPGFEAPGFEEARRPDLEFERLDPNRIAVIDIENPLAEAERFKISAEIEMGGQDYLILDMRESPRIGRFIFPFDDDTRVSGKVQFMIVDKSFDPTTKDLRHGIGYKGIRTDEPVAMGRQHNRERFAYSATTSADHAELLYDAAGNLTIRDLHSTNGTYVKASTINQVSPQEYVRMRRGAAPQPPRHQENRYDERGDDAGDARKAQQAAARKIREQEERDMRAAQAERRVQQVRERAEREAAQRREDAAIKRAWQAKIAERDRQIGLLEFSVRQVLNMEDERNRRVINIPGDLSINDAANVVREIIQLRRDGTPDKKIFRGMALKLHPDPKGSDTEKAQQELRFKFLGQLYDDKAKSGDQIIGKFKF